AAAAILDQVVAGLAAAVEEGAVDRGEAAGGGVVQDEGVVAAPAEEGERGHPGEVHRGVAVGGGAAAAGVGGVEHQRGIAVGAGDGQHAVRLDRAGGGGGRGGVVGLGHADVGGEGGGGVVGVATGDGEGAAGVGAADEARGDVGAAGRAVAPVDAGRVVAGG